MKRNFGIILLALCCVVAVGCKKDPVEPVDPVVPSEDLIAGDVWVLNEGGWGNNDAELSVLNRAEGSVENDIFVAKNGRGLGDVAQDLMVYGSKMYVVVWGSNVVEVLNSKTGKSIKQISFAGKGPRYAVGEGGKVYVCCYDGTVAKIDTVGLEIEACCEVTGMQPEGICVAGDKLCVLHGWKNDENGNAVYDSTMSVVDIATFSSERKMTVGLNPFYVMAYDENHVIVGYNGNYGVQPSGIMKVNLTTGERTTLKNDGASEFVIYQGELYGYQFDWSSNKAAFWKINLATGAQTDLLKNITVDIKTPYCMSVDPRNGDIYVGDAQQFRSSGDVHCFTKDGELKWSVEVGMRTR